MPIEETEKQKQKRLLIEMMRDDEKLGLYDETNGITEEQILELGFSHKGESLSGNRCYTKGLEWLLLSPSGIAFNFDIGMVFSIKELKEKLKG